MLSWFKRAQPTGPTLDQKIAALDQEAAEWRRDWIDLGHRAYCIDAMAEPMRWGRMQNRANWAGWHMKECEKKAQALREQRRKLRDG